MKKLFLLLFLLTSCQEPAPSSENQLRLCVDDSPATLDPRLCGTRRVQVLTKALFEGLTRITPDGIPNPAIAETIDISPDGRHYTFHLRKTVWSDGTPLTAHDFERAWKSILSPGFPPILAEFLHPLDEFHAKDSYTFLVHLAYPAPYFLELIANPVFSPLPPNPDLYNGPFTLETWQRDQTLLFKKNPLYWDADTVQLDSVEILIVKDGNTAFELFGQKKIDWAGAPFFSLPLEIIQSLNQQGRLNTLSINSDFHFTLNTKHPIYSSKKIRQALGFAISRKTIVDHIFVAGEKPLTTLLPPNLTLHDAPLFTDGNVAKARILFAEGLEELAIDDLPTLLIHFRNEPDQKRIAQIVQQQWQEAFDIDVAIEGHASAGFFSALFRGDFDCGGYYAYSIFNDPMYNLEIFTGSMNNTGWQDPTYTLLINQAREELDPKQRNQLLKTAEALIIDEMPIIPLLASAFAWVQSERLTGVYVSESGYNTDLKWSRVASSENEEDI